MKNLFIIILLFAMFHDNSLAKAITAEFKSNNNTVVSAFIHDCANNFNYDTADGTTFRCRVPDGVTSMKVDLAGGEGGSSSNYAMGGKGGRVVTEIAVDAGEVLCLVVGGAGSNRGVGGANGGGRGGRRGGGGGGGASHIARGECTLSDRIVVAAGGGGKSSNCNGGDGGGLIGGKSGTEPTQGSSDRRCISVKGGTQNKGGVARNNMGNNGNLGIGGDGMTSCGGGGGGYYGGGGGAISTARNFESGGSGGSSISFGKNTSMFPGYNSGDGYIKLSFEVPKKYHVVLILTDDQGYGDVGYRDSHFSTPNIDALAANGIRLERMYGQHSCSPARATLLTGLYANRLDIVGYPYLSGENRTLSRDFSLLPQYLKAEGYRTVGVGKWHLGMQTLDDYPTRRGFDTYFGSFLNTDYYNYVVGGKVFRGRDLFENELPAQEYFESGIYVTELAGMKAVEYIEAHPNDTNTPLFLYLPFSAPHTPLQAPHSYSDRCESILYSSVEEKVNKKTLCMMMAAIDDAIGEVTAALRRKNMFNDTIFLYASDNGGVISSGSNMGGFNGQKASLLEGGVRIPSFIGGAPISEGSSAGLMFDGMTHLTDIFATILDIAGADLSSFSFDGTSLLAGVNLNPQFYRSEIHLAYTDYPYCGNSFGVVFESGGRYWKYTYLPNTIAYQIYEDVFLKDVYLFDLTTDPAETINILNNYTELRFTAETSIPNFLGRASDTQRNLRGTLSHIISQTESSEYYQLCRAALDVGIAMVNEIKSYSRPFQIEADGYIIIMAKYSPTAKGCYYPKDGPNADIDCFVEPLQQTFDIKRPNNYPDRFINN